MRTVASETLFKLIFSSQFIGNVEENLKKSLYKTDKLTEDDVNYCERLLSLMQEHEESLLNEIDSHSTLFPEKRIFPADKSILLVALAEILYMDDIPASVSAN